MPAFGPASTARILTCTPGIQAVFYEVIKHVDCAVLEGVRSTELQQQYFAEGKSELDGINRLSKHQQTPSRAIDAIPFPTNLHGVSIWRDEFRFTLFAGFVLGIGAMKGVPLRWGGDWNRDGSKTDQSFHDLPHFEEM
jgi:peptidoglycan LD-endopeptidase CwlK